MDIIPPSHAGLNQHVRRAAYRAGHIWGQNLGGRPSGATTRTVGLEED